MPTPPWCTETQVAPPTALIRAFKIGQSAMASLPSRASVSRLGEATEPQSRWSRPMTMGALISPWLQVVNNSAEAGTLAVSQPADTGRQPLELHLSPAMRIQRARCSSWANSSRITRSVRAMSAGSLKGRPSGRALALAEERANIGRDKPGS